MSGATMQMETGLESFFTNGEWLSQDASLWTLAAVSFLASTLLPLGSEAVLFAVLRLHPDASTAALAVATIFNTAGGMTTYGIGRYLARRKPLQHVELMRRWGSPLLLFAWLPIVGDGLVLAAGWLQANWLAAALFQAAGRYARYWVVVESAAL